MNLSLVLKHNIREEEGEKIVIRSYHIEKMVSIIQHLTVLINFVPLIFFSWTVFLRIVFFSLYRLLILTCA